MKFNNKNRELSGSYIKDKRDNSCFNYSIYLGKNDSPDNYEEITKEEYDKLILENEEKIRKEMEELDNANRY